MRVGLIAHLHVAAHVHGPGISSFWDRVRVEVGPGKAVEVQWEDSRVGAAVCDLPMHSFTQC